jgi:multicomponent Na+:H+ antiporter subunit G
MNRVIADVLLLLGASFLLLAAIGVLRMPDLFMRMSAATKGTTLGIACMLLAVGIYFPGLGITTRTIATIVFFFLTAPVAAHMIGRAAYFIGVPLWEGTVLDELRGRYDPFTHALDREPAPEAAEEGQPRRAPTLIRLVRRSLRPRGDGSPPNEPRS